IQPTFGRTWTYAEYLELNVPLLKDVPFAKALSVDLANRWSQFRWQGGTPGTPEAGLKNGTSASTGRIQVRWQPISDLVVRGSWAQGFRAPSISDLYNSGGASYNILQDPCAPASQGGNWVAGTPLPAGCLGVEHEQNGTRIQTATGGNPLLTPEKAISRSAGFTNSPHWIDDFSFGADYYMIDLTNEIGTVPAQYILNECYVKQSPQNCNLITLTGGSFIEDLPSATSASGFQTVQELSYAANHVPKLRGVLSLNWNIGNLSAVWNVTYIGKIFENCSALTKQLSECSLPTTVYPPTGSVGEHELNRVIYNDAAFTYNIEPIKTNITLGVQNVFNQSFPLEYTAGAPPNLDGEMGYRLPGRFIYARLGVKF